jgi:GcrA cell cycle regulator
MTETVLQPDVVVPVETEPVAAPVAVSRRQGCSLLELTSRSCRWPIGNPRSEDFRYCGATTDVQP